MINRKTNTPPPGGYVQFEKCLYGDCRYKDAATGRGVFAACILTEDDESDLPKITGNFSYKCNICGKIVSKSFKAINITICDRCLARLKKSASCHKCGNSPL